MNQTSKTIIFAVVAVVLAVAAYKVVPTKTRPELFDDQGALFYESFNPLACTSVEIVDYDEHNKVSRFFKVHFKNNRWTIPSHEDYPADAKEQLGKTAAVVNGLKKGAVRSEQKKDFAEFGVLDPLAEGEAAEGIGKRVTLKDATGKVLSDLIVGKSVEGRWGQHYVRRPDSKRVYACKIDASNISTRFADWVETDLLKVPKDKIKEIVLDNYRVDEATSVKVPGDVLTLKQEDPDEWTLTIPKGGLKDNEELDKDKIDDITGALKAITLVGVRRKPKGLLEVLERVEKGKAVQRQEGRALQALLARVGYYLGQDPRTGNIDVVSNEGEVRIACDDGARYTLLFGEILYGEPDEISAAPDKKTEKNKTPKKETTEKKDKTGEKDEEERGAEHRYLFVRVSFDQGLMGEKPKKPEETKEPKAVAKKKAAPKAEAKVEKKDKAKKPEPPDPQKEYEKAKKAYKEDLKQYEEDLKDYEKRVKERKDRVEELRKRFADWYYVISADAFKKLHLSRKDLVKEKKVEEKKDEGKKAKEKPADAEK